MTTENVSILFDLQFICSSSKSFSQVFVLTLEIKSNMIKVPYDQNYLKYDNFLDNYQTQKHEMELSTKPQMKSLKLRLVLFQ